MGLFLIQYLSTQCSFILQVHVPSVLGNNLIFSALCFCFSCSLELLLFRCRMSRIMLFLFFLYHLSCVPQVIAKLLFTSKNFAFVILIQVLSSCFCSDFSISLSSFLFISAIAYLPNNTRSNIASFVYYLLFLFGYLVVTVLFNLFHGGNFPQVYGGLGLHFIFRTNR